MDAVTGVVEVTKLDVNSISFLVTGSYDEDIMNVILKVDSMDLHTKMRLLERLIKDYTSNYELVFRIG